MTMFVSRDKIGQKFISEIETNQEVKRKNKKCLITLCAFITIARMENMTLALL